MSLFPKARPTYWPNPQVRRRIDTHAFVESGQSDHRGTPICDDCGHLSTSAVHAPDALTTCRRGFSAKEAAMSDDGGCCALDPGHDGACAWLCPDCHGSTYCWACGGPSGDDLGTGCGECDGTGSCFRCYEGMVSDEWGW